MTTAPATNVDYFKVLSGEIADSFGLRTFTRSDGALASTETTGPDGQGFTARAWTCSTWTISSNKAINTPVGTEHATDPGLEGTYTAGLNTSLTKSGAATVSQSADVHGGSKAQYFQAAAQLDYISSSTASIAAGKWFRAIGWAKRLSGTAGTVRMLTGAAPVSVKTAITQADYTKNVIATVRLVAGTKSAAWAYQSSSGAAPFDEVVIDDISIKSFSLSEVAAYVDVSVADVVVEVDITFESFPERAPSAGLMLNLDAAFTNYVQVAVGLISNNENTCSVYVLKNVAGTFTEVLTPTTVAYSAGAKLQVYKYGTSYRIFYNDLAVGSALTISDATVISNKNHGIFSVYEGNTLDNFAV